MNPIVESYLLVEYIPTVEVGQSPSVRIKRILTARFDCWNDSLGSFFLSFLCYISKQKKLIFVVFIILASTEKRNLAKAQNAQKKEEIQKRLEKVQTQLGTKTKQPSVSSLTKRG